MSTGHIGAMFGCLAIVMIVLVVVWLGLLVTLAYGIAALPLPVNVATGVSLVLVTALIAAVGWVIYQGHR